MKTRSKGILWIRIFVSAVFLIGMLTFLKPCGMKDDGMWMNCHNAGQVLTGLAAAMTAVSLIALFVKNAGIRKALSVLLIVLSGAVLAVPGPVIPLCMMPDMRCRAVMRPGSLVLAILIILISVIAIAIERKEKT